MNRLLLYLHTLRHLRPRQVAGRLARPLKKLCLPPGRFLRRPAPPYPGCGWQPRGDFAPPCLRRNPASDIRAGSLSFLNVTQDVGWPPRWTEIRGSALWKYNLHYFDYLWALDYESARELVSSWIALQKELSRGPAWDPYPVSLRLGNWLCFFFGQYRAEAEADTAFRDRLWHSIHAQAEWLTANLETHLLGNHLFENAAALTLAGTCFMGDTAGRWKSIGTRLLREEIKEQILPDGGHFERSPMYQARVVRVLSQLANTGNAELMELAGEPLRRAASALAQMCHPDGEIALLNDSALSEQPRDAAIRPAAGAFALPDTGYYGWRGADGTYLFCDAAPIGPDYIPGHAHGDIFSFELSLKGHRVIVDSGVHDYEFGAIRDYCRSTAAHNTIEVNGEDQCEFWGAFRVARRGWPHDVRWAPSEDGFELKGWHDGYGRLPGRPRHARVFEWRAPVLRITDTVEAAARVVARSRLHLHPSCRILEQSENKVRIGYPAGEFEVVFEGEGNLSVEPSRYFPEFGKEEDNLALVFLSSGTHIETTI
ncbi:MAG: alginate lyase family protein, partial [Kiritimatiellae bacterium]|nr:alginate lyase family protein [Kiritimatiellia bacterium]